MVPLILDIGITWELSDRLHSVTAVPPLSSGPQTVWIILKKRKSLVPSGI